MSVNLAFDTNNQDGVVLKNFTPLPSDPSKLTREDALKVFVPEAVTILVKEMNKR